MQNKFLNPFFILLIICVVFLIAVYFFANTVSVFFTQVNLSSSFTNKTPNETTKITLSHQPEVFKPLTVGFWGDMMLARNVELLSDIYGGDYSFLKINDLFSRNDFNLINFEGTVPLYHERTLSNVMRFSVSKNLLPQLGSINITHASLANNHGLDFGFESYNNTKEKLQEQNIITFGHPSKIDSSSIIYLDLGRYRLSVMALHTLYVIPNDEDLENIFRIMRATSDLQIVYVHWGIEYDPSHSQSQSALATKLISLGADTIIGHHPHVVQDIELIDGVPVFYSLGNTVFDQYFSATVQEGYGIELLVSENDLEFTLLPITSIDKHSQPRSMLASEQVNFFNSLATKSDPLLQDNIKQGKLIFPFKLASSL